MRASGPVIKPCLLQEYRNKPERANKKKKGFIGSQK
jgi:hypothetical protein